MEEKKLEKKVKLVNKKFVCVDGKIQPRPPKIKVVRPTTDWQKHLKAYYTKAKARDKSYTYKQAMKNASKTYTKTTKSKSKVTPEVLEEKHQSPIANPKVVSSSSKTPLKTKKEEPRVVSRPITIAPTKSKKLIADLIKHTGKSEEYYKAKTKEQLQKRWLKIYGTSNDPPTDTKELILGLMDILDKPEKYFKKMTRTELEKLWNDEVNPAM